MGRWLSVGESLLNYGIVVTDEDPGPFDGVTWQVGALDVLHNKFNRTHEGYVRTGGRDDAVSGVAEKLPRPPEAASDGAEAEVLDGPLGSDPGQVWPSSLHGAIGLNEQVKWREIFGCRKRQQLSVEFDLDGHGPLAIGADEHLWPEVPEKRLLDFGRMGVLRNERTRLEGRVITG